MVTPSFAHQARTSGADAGFSLVELLVATAITTTLIGTVILVTSQVQNSYSSQLDGAAVQQEARYALEWITFQLRSAGGNPDNITVGSCPATGTTFRAIRRDPNVNGVQDDIQIHADGNPPNGLLGGDAGACTEAGEDVTIAYDAASRTITRRDNNTEAAAVAMTDRVITQLQFAYLDVNRAETTNDSAVVFVQVSVSAQTPTPDPYTGQPRTYTHTSEVHLRAR